MDGFAMIRTGRLLACALLALALLIAGKSALADSTITISDVHVDVTAKSAADARDQAIAQAQARAFDRLVRRLVANPADQARVKPGQAEIEGMVQDFAVQSERTSAVRYIGIYTVRFRSGRVRKYLSDAGVSAIGDVQEVLVLPVYQSASGPVLWGPTNLWRAAWDRGGFGDEPATLILPNGDPFDTGTLSASAAASGDTAALDAIMQRYHIAGVVVAVAEPRDPSAGAASGLKIAATTYDSTGPKGTQSLAIDPQGGEPADKTLHRGVLSLAEALESQWRQAGGTGLAAYTPPPGMYQGPDHASAVGTLYPVSIPLSSVADWVAARDRLAAIPGVQGVTLDALTREGAAVTISFAGDPVALQAALAGSGYVLAQTAQGNASGPGNFQLQPSSSVTPQPAGPPPAPSAPAQPDAQ